MEKSDQKKFDLSPEVVDGLAVELGKSRFQDVMIMGGDGGLGPGESSPGGAPRRAALPKLGAWSF